MKKNIIFILLSVFIMAGVTIYIAIQFNNSKLKEFVKDGYVLTTENNEDNSKTSRYYFSSGTKYKEKYQDKVSFSDVEGDKVSLDNDAFVHYLDNSVSTLKKGVVMDLDSISGSVVKYYNIFPKSLLEKRNDGYFVNNLGKQLKFSNFVVKTSDSKYLVISDKITLFLSENQAIDIKGYIELNFIEGDIIRLENQEVSYQTISSDSYIELANDIKIDLGTGNIYVGEEKKVALNQMIIDSNDNVEITPTEEENKETENEGNNSSSGQQGENGTNGGVNGGTIGGEEQVVDETENTQIPVFTISNLEVTSNKIDATISITDDDNLLTSGTSLKIIENSTGKVVYMLPENENGQFDIDLLVENLNPETNYTLIATATYTKDNVEYTKDFISKSFRTESLGIEISKNYYTTSELSYLVKIDDYSQIKAATVTLYDSNGVATANYIIDSELAKEGLIVTFTGLNNNSSYKVKLSDFHYDNTIIADGYEIEMSAKTLKNEPLLGQTSFKISKKNSLFTLSYDNVTDSDNGIVSYRYEIYDARDINSANPQAIKIIEKDYNSSIDINVDDIIVFRNEPYVFKVVVDFYDNEKHIEYESAYSSIMQLDGSVFPTVSLTNREVTFERIRGTIEITDEGNTIDLSEDKNILIVYQNSLGDSTTITSSANLTIPLDINNLRANETYSISIYATVDLSDDNAIIDNCLIGSIVVKTEATKPLTATLSSSNEDISTAFTINAQLGPSTSSNTVSQMSSTNGELEAKTMKRITFNLYEGIGESKTLVRSIPQSDMDDDPYISTLKESYYDNSFTITPAFFGISNSDLNDGYYTIEITDAYDYTKYKNNIPILNSTIEVKTNGVIPDLPDNPNNAVTVTRILNKNAGDKYRSDLDPNTTVGYEVKSNYDNSKKYAQYLKYYVYDATTGKKVENATKTYNVDTTGEIGNVYFYLGDGTNFSTEDTELRRGNRYYFSYEAYLDMNEDLNVDLKWPTNDVVLKSTTVDPEKQAPKFQFYLSNSTANTAIWKYTYSDIDNALVNKSISYEIGNSVVGTVDIVENTNFNSIELTNLTSGNLSLFSSVALLKTEGDIQKQYFARQNFEGVYQMRPMNFHTVVDVNRLVISINDSAQNEAYINRIVALKVTFSNGTKTIVKDNLVLDSDSVVIDLIDIAEFMNQNISISVSAYYDTGIAGFEVDSNLFALQNTLINGLGGEYYTINSRNNLTRLGTANASMFTTQFTLNTLTVNNVITSRNKILDLEILGTGIEHNTENISLKKIDSVPLSGDGTENFKFDMIIAGVSLKDSNGKLNIAPSLQDAKLKIKLFGVGASAIEDEKIQIRVFKVNTGETTGTEVDRIEVPVSDLGSANTEGNLLTIPDLLPQTNYYLELYANVWNGTTYQETQLYDIDSKSPREQYPFSTLFSVGISGIEVKYDYENSEYGSKNIKITYDLAQTVGYDRIEYKLYKIIPNQDGTETRTLVDIDIPYDRGLLKKMEKYLPCNPGSSIEFGYDYELELTSIAKVSINGQEEERVLDDKIKQRFTLEPLRDPFIGVSSSSSKTEDGKYIIEYKVNVFDMDKVIVGGHYRIKIYDEDSNDITPDEYKNLEYNITDLNKTFIIDQGLNGDLGTNEVYRLQIITDTDLTNSGENFTTIRKSFEATTVNDYGINVGTVYAVPNTTTRAMIDLNFYNTYRLNLVNEIRYSIYGQSGYSIDGRMPFTPQQKTYDQGYYYNTTLKNLKNDEIVSIVLPSKGVYYIEVQFISNGVIVAQKSIEHNYTD